MYIETSSPRKPGENAKLVVTVPSDGKEACLSFYYHMYGDTVGTLNVYSGNNKVFNASGNQSNSWKIVERNVRLEGVVSPKRLLLLYKHTHTYFQRTMLLLD